MQETLKHHDEPKSCRESALSIVAVERQVQNRMKRNEWHVRQGQLSNLHNR